MTQLTLPRNSKWIISYGQGHRLQYEVTHQHPKYLTEPDNYALINPISHPNLKWSVKLEPVVVSGEFDIYFNTDPKGVFLQMVGTKNFVNTASKIATQKITITDGVATVKVVK